MELDFSDLTRAADSFLCVYIKILTPHLLEHPLQCTVYFGLIWQVFLSGRWRASAWWHAFMSFSPPAGLWVNAGQECEEIVRDIGHMDT